MRIGILSDCGSPTRPSGGHGLGRVAIDLANGLRALGHIITLYGADGSSWGGGAVITHSNERDRAVSLFRTRRAIGTRASYPVDVFVDLSHSHVLSKIDKFAPVVNYLMDFECDWDPPNAAIANDGARFIAPGAERVPLGIDVDAIPIRLYGKARGHESYAVYAAKIHAHKGYDLAIEAAARAGIGLQMAGQNLAGELLTNWRESLSPDEFYKWVGGAAVHLAPYRRDAGSRVALEAAACGTATITFDRSATKYHVEHGVSGWIVSDVHEMADAIADVCVMSPRSMREWVQSEHRLDVMCAGIVRLCERVRDGEMW